MIADESDNGTSFLSPALRSQVLSHLQLDPELWVEIIKVSGVIPRLACNSLLVVFGSVMITEPDFLVGELFSGDFAPIGSGTKDDKIVLRSEEESVVLCFTLQAPCEVKVVGTTPSGYIVNVAGVPWEVTSDSGIAAKDIKLFNAIQKIKAAVNVVDPNFIYGGVTLSALNNMQQLWEQWPEVRSRRSRRSSSSSVVEFKALRDDPNVRIASFLGQNGPPQALEFWSAALSEVCSHDINAASNTLLLEGMDFVLVHESCVFNSTMLDRSTSHVLCLLVVQGMCILEYTQRESDRYPCEFVSRFNNFSFSGCGRFPNLPFTRKKSEILRRQSETARRNCSRDEKDSIRCRRKKRAIR